MDYISTWSEVLVTSLQNLWIRLINYIPQIIGALVVLIIGLFVASALGGLAKKILGFTQVDKLIQKTGVIGKFDKAGLKFSFAGLVGWVVKWFFIIVVLITVVDILRWDRVTEFLQEVALYLPNVVVAIIILVIGLVIGQLIYEVVEKSVKASRLAHSAAKPLAALAKWSIVIFALMAALVQLGVAASLIQILFTGLVAMLALAGGLAFGLGGKEKAKEWLDKISSEVSKEK